jgi:putative ABC transport system permease protein
MFVALRDLAHARGRFGLVALVIAFVAFLLVLLDGLVAGLLHNTVSGITRLPFTHIAFERDQRPTFGNSMVDRATWEEWAKRAGVKRAEPAGYTLFNARVGEERSIDLVLWGLQPGSAAGPRVTSGQRVGAKSNGVVIAESLAAEKGVRIGDVIALDRVLTELEVIGIAEAARIGHVPLVYAPLAKWQEATYGPPGGAAPGDELPAMLFDYASVILLDLDPTADVAAADAALGTTTRTLEGAYSVAPAYTEELFTVRMMRGFLLIVSAVLVGAFFVVWQVQRTKEIGLLKALGASNAWMLRDALGQALVLLVSAAILGAIGAWFAGKAVAASGLSVRMELLQVLGAGTLLVVTGLLGAALSTRLIVRVDPIIALGRERQRVGIARALMNDPGILLIDEPTSMLVQERGRETVRLLAERCRQHKVAALMVTHDRSMLEFADRVFEMKDGRPRSPPSAFRSRRSRRPRRKRGRCRRCRIGTMPRPSRRSRRRSRSTAA